MAGVGLGAPQGPMTPPQPTPAMPQAAPGGPMGSPMPGPMMGPMGQAAPATPSPYNDLSANMGHQWQLVDAAIRTLNMATDTGGFRQQPAVAAAVRSVTQTLTRLLSAYSAGTSAPTGAPAESERGALDDSSSSISDDSINDAG